MELAVLVLLQEILRAAAHRLAEIMLEILHPLCLIGIKFGGPFFSCLLRRLVNGLVVFELDLTLLDLVDELEEFAVLELRVVAVHQGINCGFIHTHASPGHLWGILYHRLLHRAGCRGDRLCCSSGSGSGSGGHCHLPELRRWLEHHRLMQHGRHAGAHHRHLRRVGPVHHCHGRGVLLLLLHVHMLLLHMRLFELSRPCAVTSLLLLVVVLLLLVVVVLLLVLLLHLLLVECVGPLLLMVRLYVAKAHLLEVCHHTVSLDGWCERCGRVVSHERSSRWVYLSCFKTVDELLVNGVSHSRLQRVHHLCHARRVRNVLFAPSKCSNVLPLSTLGKVAKVRQRVGHPAGLRSNQVAHHLGAQ
mmetsp:Transcript_3461/g.5084  ORF Transcript_3461/g.5084 Transcript_3461/m.5084 type:complete len:360 (-) Transcript_3461:14-1093(-)